MNSMFNINSAHVIALGICRNAAQQNSKLVLLWKPVFAIFAQWFWYICIIEWSILGFQCDSASPVTSDCTLFLTPLRASDENGENKGLFDLVILVLYNKSLRHLIICRSLHLAVAEWMCVVTIWQLYWVCGFCDLVILRLPISHLGLQRAHMITLTCANSSLLYWKNREKISEVSRLLSASLWWCVGTRKYIDTQKSPYIKSLFFYVTCVGFVLWAPLLLSSHCFSFVWLSTLVLSWLVALILICTFNALCSVIIKEVACRNKLSHKPSTTSSPSCTLFLTVCLIFVFLAEWRAEAASQPDYDRELRPTREGRHHNSCGQATAGCMNCCGQTLNSSLYSLLKPSQRCFSKSQNQSIHNTAMSK